MIRIIFFIIAICVYGKAFSQNITTDRITWMADRTANLKNDDRFNFQCLFKTNGSVIQWIQKGGERVNSLTITATEGDWTNVQERGKIRYSASKDGLEGFIVFERSEQESVTITLDFSGKDPNGISQKFYVSKVEKEN